MEDAYIIGVLFCVLMLVSSVALYFVPRNPWFGYRVGDWIFSSDAVWRKAHRMLGVAGGAVSAAFLFAFLFGKKEDAMYYIIAYSVAFTAASIFPLYSAYKLYRKTMRDEGVEAPAKIKKPIFTRADKFLWLCAFVICSALMLYSYVADYAAIWGNRLATHFDARGVPNGYMTASDSFLQILCMLLCAWGIALLVGFFGALSIGRQTLFSGRFETGMLGLGAIFALMFGFFSFSINSMIAASGDGSAGLVFSVQSGAGFAASAVLLLSFIVLTGIAGYKWSSKNRALHSNYKKIEKSVKK